MNQPMARGLAGALLGGGAGALFSGGLAYGNKKENETPEARRRRIFRQALLGTGMGASLGAAGGYFTTDTVRVKEPTEGGLLQGISDWFSSGNPSASDAATTQAWLENQDVTGRDLVDGWNDLGVAAAGTAAGVGAAASTDVGSKGYHKRLVQLRRQVGTHGANTNLMNSPGIAQIDAADKTKMKNLLNALAGASDRQASEQAAANLINSLKGNSGSFSADEVRGRLYEHLRKTIAPNGGQEGANKMYDFMRQVLGASDADARAIVEMHSVRPTNNRIFGSIKRHTALHNYLQPGERPIRDKLTGAKRMGAKGIWPLVGAFGINAARHKINERQYQDRDTKLDILRAIENTMKSNGGDWSATRRTLEQQMPDKAGLVAHMMGTLIKQLEGSK